MTPTQFLEAAEHCVIRRNDHHPETVELPTGYLEIRWHSETFFYFYSPEIHGQDIPIDRPTAAGLVGEKLLA